MHVQCEFLDYQDLFKNAFLFLLFAFELKCIDCVSKPVSYEKGMIDRFMNKQQLHDSRRAISSIRLRLPITSPPHSNRRIDLYHVVDTQNRNGGLRRELQTLHLVHRGL